LSSELRNGWRIIVAGGLGLMVTASFIHTLGVVMKPLQDEFGWGRDDISFVSMIVASMAVVMTPIVGYLVDRVGYRKIVLIGFSIYCVALFLISQAGPSLDGWYLRWALLAFAFAFLTVTWTTGVAKNFDKSRGVAIAFSMIGSAMATLAIPFIMAIVVEAYGWRGAFMGLAAFGAFLVLPVTWFWFKPQPGLGDVSVPMQRVGVDRREIFLSARYWQLAIICVLAMYSILGMTIHFVPILTDRGLSLTAVAAVAGFNGAGSIIGRLSAGYFLDRIHGSWIGMFAVSCPLAAALILLTGAHSIYFAAVVAFLIGLGNGVENDVIAYITSRYFGLRNFGIAFSTIGGFITIGHGLGSYIAGVTFERVGNYSLFLTSVAVALTICLVLFARLGSYPDFDQPKGDEHGDARG
jgi:predicted MFS family arabinose efflux permease